MDKSKRRFPFLLPVMILAVVALVRFWPDSAEERTAPSPAPADASRQPTTFAPTVDAKSATPSGTLGRSNGSVPPAATQQFAPLRLDVRAPAKVRSGETFQATVDVGADRGIQQLRFTVTFDKRVLELAGSSAGTFVQNAGVPAQFVAQEPSYGVVLVNFDVDNGSAVAGTGSVVLLEFQALKAGTSPVAVEDITLVEQGSAGASSAPSVQPVSVTVE